MSQLSFLVPVAVCAGLLFAAPRASAQQFDCRDTPEGRLCRSQQRIVGGTPVDVQTQQEFGLVTVGGGCSGTLLNRFWVLTADHCLSNNGRVAGPDQTFTGVPITAAWSPRTVIPTRFVRNWGGGGLDVALVFLGAGDFGNARIQLIYVNEVEVGSTLMKFGRGIAAYASAGPPPVAASGDGPYRSAVFSASAANSRLYTLPVNAASQVGNGGDSGGPDFMMAPNGVLLGVAGVQSTCVSTGRVPGMPDPPFWRWVTGISSCNSASIATARFDIVQIIQEGRVPCPDTSAACAVLETTSLTLMLK